jgi:hypothetical protein
MVGNELYNRESLMIAFAPASIIGVLFLVAIACGVYAAT